MTGSSVQSNSDEDDRNVGIPEIPSVIDVISISPTPALRGASPPLSNIHLGQNNELKSRSRVTITNTPNLNFSEKKVSPNLSGYVPPLPYFTNLPKRQELRVSNQSKQQQLKYFRVPPQSSVMTMQGSGGISGSSNNIGLSTQIANKRNLKSVQGIVSGKNRITGGSLPLSQQQHVVVDIFPPKPPVESARWSQIPDQTLGIPLIQNTKPHHQPPKSQLFPRQTIIGQIYPKFNSMTQPNDILQPIIHQYPLILGNIPPTSNFDTNQNHRSGMYGYERGPPISPPPVNRGLPLPPLLISGIGNTSSILSNGNSASTKEPGEKQKVKFSDTITVAVVPVSF